MCECVHAYEDNIRMTNIMTMCIYIYIYVVYMTMYITHIYDYTYNHYIWINMCHMYICPAWSLLGEDVKTQLLLNQNLGHGCHDLPGGPLVDPNTHWIAEATWQDRWPWMAMVYMAHL